MPDLVIDTARMLIDGQERDALSGETLDVLNPSTGALITRLPAGGHPDVDAAVASAKQAFERWSWGGVKDSGSGKQSGRESFDSFATIKAITVRTAPDDVDWYGHDTHTRLN